MIGEIYRENRWEYPLLALREVVINAVVHRDYSVYGSDIKIAIFDDMIEIISPGILIIDKAKLGRGYSELRNPNLGNLFKKLEIIEQWGTGYQKIEEALKDYPEIKVEVDDSSSFVKVKFIKVERLETAQENTRERIVSLLIENPYYTKKDLMRFLNKADGTIKEHLARLKGDGIIERIGSTKAGHWKVNYDTGKNM